jgi:hypothetical protein
MIESAIDLIESAMKHSNGRNTETPTRRQPRQGTGGTPVAVPVKPLVPRCRNPNPSASFPRYAVNENLQGCQATTAPGQDGGARCGSRHHSGAGGSGAGHALAVGRPVMPPAR